MFDRQPRSSRHNILRERIVREDVQSQPAQLGQAEEARQVFEAREAVETSVQIRKPVKEVTTFAGCKETRKSSSAGVVMLGDHTLKSYTRKQNIIARSSAEAEPHTSIIGSVRIKRDRVVVERVGV